MAYDVERVPPIASPREYVAACVAWRCELWQRGSWTTRAYLLSEALTAYEEATGMSPDEIFLASGLELP